VAQGVGRDVLDDTGLDAMLINLANLHEWRVALFSPEQLPLKRHVASLLQIYQGQPFNEMRVIQRMDKDAVQSGMDWLSKLDAESIAKYQAAQGELSSALGKLLMITENYPTLTATENFKDLQSQIEGTENRIAVSRKDFGDSVQTYNTKVSQFPGNIVAKLFGFAPKAYFKADQSAAAAPSVAF
jgi:hypothetical protein